MDRRDKGPSKVSLVQQALSEADDFMTVQQIVTASGCNTNQVCASLFHLRKWRAADMMTSEGVTYWFLTGEDQRRRTVDIRVIEEPGARRRRKIVK